MNKQTECVEKVAREEASELAIQKAAQAWCTPTTHKFSGLSPVRAAPVLPVSGLSLPPITANGCGNMWMR